MCAGGTSIIYINPSGRAPFNIHVLQDGALYDMFSGVTGPFNIQVSPAADAVFTIGQISDNLGIIGSSSGSASVVVNPIPTVTLSTQDNRSTFQVTECSGSTESPRERQLVESQFLTWGYLFPCNKCAGELALELSKGPTGCC